MLPATKSKLPGIKSVIGIMSGKGGVGKTFVTASLAISLTKAGKKVGILDADLSCPNMYKILGITAKLAPTADNKLFPIEKFGVKVISMAGLTGSEDEAIAWRGPIISKIIQQLMKESLWGELDFLLIDFPSGTNDASITILQNFHVDGALVVVTPQQLALLDARKTISALGLMKIPAIGIIENMRGEIFGEGGGMRLAEMYQIPMLGSIPMRRQIVTLCDAGTPAIFHMEELEMIFAKINRVLLESVAAE